jgi:DNA-binding transcriptional MerR regulator
MKQDEFLIQDLAEETGVSPRTIRYYQQEGLLPEPDNRGKFAYYNQDHRKRLLLIQELKKNFLPLKEIRDRMNSLTSQQVQSLLEEQNTEDIQKAHSGQIFIIQQAQADSDTAVDYIARLLKSQSHTHTQDPGIKPNLHLQKAPPQQYISGSPAESWRRIFLASGKEILIKEPISPQDQKRLEELIKFAQKLFT